MRLASAPASAVGGGADATDAALAALSPADAAEVERFRALLRCVTAHPDPTAGYAAAGVLLEAWATELGLAFERLELAPGHPIFLLTWAASARAPGAGAILLNSHLDVVPVEADKWSVDPWAAVVKDGRVYGRGAQDMKCVSVQYLAAIRRLIARGVRPTARDVVLSFVPDEEVGGGRGMKRLLVHARMAALAPAFCLDEGLASPDDAARVYFGERKVWWVRVTATGAVGHGSRLIPDTAVPKLLSVLERFGRMREAAVAALDGAHGCGRQLGDVTSVNVTVISAGERAADGYNVIPSAAWAGIDVRIPCTADLPALKATFDAWCAEAGEGVTWELIAGLADGALTNPTTDTARGEGGAWYALFEAAARAGGMATHAPSVFPAATDARWLRLLLGVPALGFSPITRTPVLLHDHDEHLGVDAFVRGVGVYEALIPALAGAPAGAPYDRAAPA